jgi:hypothetical protein
MARAGDIELIGLDVGGSDVFTLEASGYRIEMNGGSNGSVAAAINFSKMDGGKFTVETGPGQDQTFEFDYKSGLQRVAIENAVLTIENYLYISGGISFTRQTALTVTLSGTPGTTRVVDAFSFGAGSVDIFAGDSPNGPYFDGTDEHPDGATGLVLENVNFGFVVMRPTSAAQKGEKYLALEATANFAGLIGIDGFKLSAAGITVEYNGIKSSGPNTTKVVDFNASGGFSIDTGNGEIELDYDSKRLLVSIEEADLQIADYVLHPRRPRLPEGRGPLGRCGRQCDPDQDVRDACRRPGPDDLLRRERPVLDRLEWRRRAD